MTPNLPVVVCSDVGGRLLDSHTASFDAVCASLDFLRRERVPIVFCSSKTRAEMEHIQQRLDLRHPFISENGGAVFVPEGYFGFNVPNARQVAGYQAVEYGWPYADVVEKLHRTAERLRIDIVGFSDMSVDEVAIDCGLPLLQARLAKLREYDEPFRILGVDPSARTRLFKALGAIRLGGTTGGRYEHAGTPPAGKWAGVSLLCALYRRAFGAVSTVGLGGDLSDVSWLRHVDIPVIASRETDMAAALRPHVPTVRLPRAVDEAGWGHVIAEVVQLVRQGGAVVPRKRRWLSMHREAR